MATAVIMPALGMAQETGRLVRWLKQDGENVTKGEPLMEVETDKATVEVEAPASGHLGKAGTKEGDDVPVGQTIAWVLAPGETVPETAEVDLTPSTEVIPANSQQANPGMEAEHLVDASVVARNIAADNRVDLSQIRPKGKRIEKADVLAYIQEKSLSSRVNISGTLPDGSRLLPASPKARRLAKESGLDLAKIKGTGPENAVLVVDVLTAQEAVQRTVTPIEQTREAEEVNNHKLKRKPEHHLAHHG